MELIPGFPEELGLECLTRSHYTTHRFASQTCHEWRELLKTPDFYHYRKQKGYTHKMACLVQSIPAKVPSQTRKPADSPSYRIAVFDSVNRTWESLSQVPKYPDGLPLFCQLASSEGKLIVMGGWDPVSYGPVKDVFVYDFKMLTWRHGKDMPSKRSFYAIGAIGERVFIAGGHDENKNALRSAWVYDVRRDEWCELTDMSQERDECEGIVIGDEFWVVSGYETNSQGMFVSSAETYCIDTGIWKRVDGVWKAGQCPRSFILAGKKGNLVSCADLGSTVLVGARGLELGGWVLVTRSTQSGVANEIYMVDTNEGKKLKMKKIDAPDEFCGFVQSGCSMEI